MDWLIVLIFGVILVLTVAINLLSFCINGQAEDMMVYYE